MKTCKYLALFMAVLITLTVMPFSASAEDTPVLLTIGSDSADSGEGWMWADNVLTLSKNAAMDAIRFGSGVTSAKIKLAGNVTLNSSDLDGTSALSADCDLEIDGGDYTLTLYSGNAAVLAVAGNLTVSGGRVYTQSGNDRYRDVQVAGSDYEIRNLTVTDAMLISRKGGIYVNGALTARNAHVTGFNIREEDEMAGISCRTLTASDSTLNANSNWYGVDCGSFTTNNCELNLYGGYEYSPLRADYRQTSQASVSAITITDTLLYDQKTEENMWGYEYAVEVFTEGEYSWVEITMDGRQSGYIEGTPYTLPDQPEGKVKELVVGGVNAFKYPTGDGWSFDAENGVLTLDNCTFLEKYVSYYTSTNIDTLIYFRGELTIELVGDNRLERAVDGEPTYETQYAVIYGDVYFEGEYDTESPLKIQGTGSLTAGVAFHEGAENWRLSNQQFAVVAPTDLSGLRDGGFADIYCGVKSYPGAFMFRAFWCAPSYGDTLLVAYNDIEGNSEISDGYNWNNNNAWRAQFVTADHYLTGGGKLILNSNETASGNGWSWADNVLTIAAEASIASVIFTDKVDSAKVVLSGDLTLKADGGQYGSTAIEAACDLMIDLNGHTLTVPAKDGASAPIFLAYPGSVTIQNGKLNVHSIPYDLEWAEQMGSDYEMGVRDIEASGGGLTLKDVKVNAPYVSFCSYSLNLETDYNEETGESTYIYYDSLPLTVEDSTVVSNSLFGEVGVSILNSKVNITGEDEAIACYTYDEPTTILMKDSTVSAGCTSEWGYLLNANNLVMDNCNVMFSGASIFYGYGADSIVMTNMTITDPVGCTIGETDYYGDRMYTFLDGDGNAATFLSNMGYRLERGRLFLNNSEPLSGNGWRWKNNVLTLAEDTEVKAVKFADSLSDAKLVLVGDVTLDARNLGQENYQYIPAIEAACDLEIDGGDRNLTLKSYGDGIRISFGDLLISGGTVDIAVEQNYNPPLAINSVGGNVTVDNATLTTDWEVSLNVGWDENNEEHPSGDLVFRNAVVENHKGFYVADGKWTVTDSTLDLTADYSGCNANGDITFRNSIVTAASNEYSEGFLFTSYAGELVFDNCELDLSCGESLFRTTYYYEDSSPAAPNMESIRFENMTVTSPEAYQVIDIRETDPNGKYSGHTELADTEGIPLKALTATAATAVCQHVYDHDYDADCNLCGNTREVTEPEETVTNQGGSISEDVSGVAGLFNMEIQGMDTEDGSTTADYTYATLGGYKLLEMGTVASNDVDSARVPARYLYRIEDDLVYYAVRVINVPEEHFNTEIRFLPYFVIEVNGEAVTLYGEQYTATYNSLVGK